MPIEFGQEFSISWGELVAGPDDLLIRFTDVTIPPIEGSFRERLRTLDEHPLEVEPVLVVVAGGEEIRGRFIAGDGPDQPGLVLCGDVVLTVRSCLLGYTSGTTRLTAVLGRASDSDDPRVRAARREELEAALRRLDPDDDDDDDDGCLSAMCYEVAYSEPELEVPASPDDCLTTLDDEEG